MRPDSTDILVAGGGPAGLATAAAFGTAGFSVICVDPQPPVTEEADPGADTRTTAILQPGRTLLEEAGVWDKLAAEAAPLAVMEIMDATAEPPLRRGFESRDLGGEAPFGWNIPNWALRRALVARLAELPTVDFRPGTGFASLVSRTAAARIRLSDGSAVDAQMVLACDGRNSAVRQAIGVDVRTTRYGQKALAFAVTHPEPHGNVSTEVHRSGGPFTLVPLPDREDRPRSAVVWMEAGPEAARLMALEPEAFSAAATERSTGFLGPLTLSGRRTLWPIISQIAQRFDGPRVALMAEAAHVVPPIGAQGLNMSLADLACLLELADAAPRELGSAAMLGRYHRRRWPDVQARVLGIDMLNRTSMAGDRTAHALRRTGIDTLHGLKPLRLMAMRLGLGARMAG